VCVCVCVCVTGTGFWCILSSTVCIALVHWSALWFSINILLFILSISFSSHSLSSGMELSSTSTFLPSVVFALNSCLCEYRSLLLFICLHFMRAHVLWTWLVAVIFNRGSADYASIFACINSVKSFLLLVILAWILGLYYSVGFNARHNSTPRISAL